jgi:hypothetical protein
MVLNASRLRWSGFHGDVPFAEAIISEVERNRSLKIFQLLAESIGQSGEPAAVHAQGMILLLDVRRGNAGDVGHSNNDRLFSLHDFGRAVPACCFLETTEMGDGEGF